MYPVEVKIGNNASDVIEKGLDKFTNLKVVLDEQLIEEKTFDARFLRNFFIRLFINNATKMNNNKIWPERDYQLDPNVVDQLLNDEFEIVNSLRADFGSGMVLSFRKGAQGETRERRQGVIVIELPEQHGYDTLAKPMNQLDELFTGRRVVVSRENQVAEGKVPYTTQSIDTNELPSMEEEHEQVTSIDEKPVVTADTSEDIPSKGEQNPFIPIEEVENMEPQSMGVRPLVGMENNRPIYWEFDHSNLSNRHLVIGGRSGQGKTYFIQSLLMDMAKSGQSAVVIDYSSSYTRKQLDDVFIEEMGDRLEKELSIMKVSRLTRFC